MTVRSWWPPGSESGWEDYHQQMYDLDSAQDGFSRWKIKSAGVNVARQVASARNRCLAAWVREHGADPLLWPLPHAPAVLWLPSSARAACLACHWVEPHPTAVDLAAASARRHAVEYLPAGRVDLGLLLAPLPVVQSYGGRDRAAPRTAG